MALHVSLDNESKSTLASVVSLARGVEAPDTLRLTTALQTTLELEKLLGIFSESLQETVRHQGLTYRNEQRGFVLGIGHAGRHSCNYRLSLLGTDLGEVVVSRNKRFAEQELAQLEYLLCSLVYPLRNALLYRDAIAAAHRDPLTGICNRAAMDQSLQRETALALRQQSNLSLIAIDIDWFKQVNDRYGHSAGDCVLRTVARRIEEELRTSDLLFRYGGEEFVVLLSGTNVAGASVVAERIRQAVATTPCACEGNNIHVTVSQGVAQLTSDSGSHLFERADRALYLAKQQGRDRVVTAQ